MTSKGESFNPHKSALSSRSGFIPMLGVFPANDVSGVTRSSVDSLSTRSIPGAPNPGKLNTPSDLSMANESLFPRPLNVPRAPNPSKLSTPSNLSMADEGFFPTLNTRNASSGQSLRGSNSSTGQVARTSDLSTVYPDVNRVYPTTQIGNNNVRYSN
jgi:hypothetical protein